jgi:hypothetical protein
METLCTIYGGEGNDHNKERYYLSDDILQFIALMEEKTIFLYVREMNPATYSNHQTIIFFFDPIDRKVDRHFFHEKLTAPTEDAVGIYLNGNHFQHVEYKTFQHDNE